MPMKVIAGRASALVTFSRLPISSQNSENTANPLGASSLAAHRKVVEDTDYRDAEKPIQDGRERML